MGTLRQARIGLILAFAAAAVFVRSWRLTDTPLWYSDETDFIGLSAELGRGVPLTQAAHKALIFPFATNAIPHPPLYFWASGLLMRVFGKGVLAGRILSATAGLISTLLLYGAVRRLWGGLAASVAAGFFAFHLPSVHLLRWGMPYNLAMGFQIAAFWALARGQRGRQRDWWNAAAVALAGGAAVSAFFGLAALGFVSLLAAVRLRSRPWILLAALAAGWAPIAAFMAVGTVQRGPAFWRDFASLMARGAGAGSLADSLRALGWQIGRLATRDGVYALGAAGLVWAALRSKGRRWAPACFAVVALPVLLKRGRDPEIKYDETEFLFLLYAGAGAAWAMARRSLCRARRRRLARRGPALRRIDLGAWALALLAIAPLAAMRVCQVSTRLPSRYEQFGSVLSPADADRVAEWINARVTNDDLIIAPDRMYFMLHGRIASLYQSVAYVAGWTTWHKGIERWRFRYPCDFRQARFIIVDRTDRALVLTPANPNMELVAAALNSPDWRVALSVGEYVVFERAEAVR